MMLTGSGVGRVVVDRGFADHVLIEVWYFFFIRLRFALDDLLTI